MKIIAINIRTRLPYMGITQIARGQKSKLGTEREAKTKYSMYSITDPFRGTVATGYKESFTTESKKENRGLEDLKLSNPRPRHLTPARKIGGKYHRGETSAL
jgi:hypothetical protein